MLLSVGGWESLGWSSVMIKKYLAGTHGTSLQLAGHCLAVSHSTRCFHNL